MIWQDGNFIDHSSFHSHTYVMTTTFCCQVDIEWYKFGRNFSDENISDSVPLMLDINFHQHERWDQRNIWYCTITNDLRKGHHLIHIRNVFDLISFDYFQIFIKKRFTCYTIDFCSFEWCWYVFSTCVCIICQNDLQIK